MDIKIINGKPTVVKNNFVLGRFDSQAQAQQAVSEVEPLLKVKGIGVITMMITVIKRNGGK